MKKILLLICIFGFNTEFSIAAKLKFVGIGYFSKIYGHVHENPSNLSSSVTTIPCGYPVKIYKKKSLKDTLWKFTKVGGEFGYIRTEFLSSMRPKCLQSKYPKYFNELNLDLSEMYYWGRLNDQILLDTSHVN
ncbi:SH3 domain-containing protein [Bacteriovoracaceae bacterium]|nr:SH3 domain-containing protein [Bacteriovoracaceae bacterium]